MLRVKNELFSTNPLRIKTRTKTMTSKVWQSDDEHGFVNNEYDMYVYSKKIEENFVISCPHGEGLLIFEIL